MAIPRPASDMIFIENATTFGSGIFHLVINYNKTIKVNDQINDYKQI